MRAVKSATALSYSFRRVQRWPRLPWAAADRRLQADRLRVIGNRPVEVLFGIPGKPAIKVGNRFSGSKRRSRCNRRSPCHVRSCLPGQAAAESTPGIFRLDAQIASVKSTTAGCTCLGTPRRCAVDKTRASFSSSGSPGYSRRWPRQIGSCCPGRRRDCRTPGDRGGRERWPRTNRQSPCRRHFGPARPCPDSWAPGHVSGPGRITLEKSAIAWSKALRACQMLPR